MHTLPLHPRWRSALRGSLGSPGIVRSPAGIWGELEGSTSPKRPHNRHGLRCTVRSRAPQQDCSWSHQAWFGASARARGGILSLTPFLNTTGDILTARRRALRLMPRAPGGQPSDFRKNHRKPVFFGNTKPRPLSAFLPFRELVVPASAWGGGWRS